MTQEQQFQQNNKYKTTQRVMRKALRQWRNDQIQLHPYCHVTGSTELLEVHHAGHSFSQIFRQAHKNLDLDFHKYIFEYNDDDVKALKEEIIRLHDMVDPIVLTHDIHCELHKIYGLEVSRQQIEQFKNNIKERMIHNA